MRMRNEYREKGNERRRRRRDGRSRKEALRESQTKSCDKEEPKRVGPPIRGPPMQPLLEGPEYRVPDVGLQIGAVVLIQAFSWAGIVSSNFKRFSHA